MCRHAHTRTHPLAGTPQGRPPSFGASRPEEQALWEEMALGALFWKHILLVTSTHFSFGKDVGRRLSFPLSSTLRESVQADSRGF